MLNLIPINPLILNCFKILFSPEILLLPHHKNLTGSLKQGSSPIRIFSPSALSQEKIVLNLNSKHFMSIAY